MNYIVTIVHVDLSRDVEHMQWSNPHNEAEESMENNIYLNSWNHFPKFCIN